MFEKIPIIENLKTNKRIFVMEFLRGDKKNEC